MTMLLLCFVICLCYAVSIVRKLMHNQCIYEPQTQTYKLKPSVATDAPNVAEYVFVFTEKHKNRDQQWPSVPRFSKQTTFVKIV